MTTISFLSFPRSSIPLFPFRSCVFASDFSADPITIARRSSRIVDVVVAASILTSIDNIEKHGALLVSRSISFPLRLSSFVTFVG